MGLKSLPILNKSGISMYWDNIWDSIKLYKKYSIGFLYLNDVVHYFLNENLYYYCVSKIKRINKNRKGIRGFKKLNVSKLTRVWNTKNFYLGKILFLSNQGWVIVSISYFNARRNKLYFKYKSSKTFKRLFKSYRFNISKRTHKLERYKFKF